MKLLKSIKWRLQFWYGLFLFVVLAGFGATSYQLERNRQFRQVDDDLHQRVGVLANALHRPPFPRGEGRPRGPFGPPDAPPDDPLGLGQPEDAPRGPGGRPRPQFHLPDRDIHFFEPGDPHDFYFSIIDRFGHSVAQSTNQPAATGLAKPVDVSTTNPPAEGPPAHIPPRTYNFGSYREVVDTMPSGETVTVGCSIVPELSDLRRSALHLSAAGGFILLLGLLGGWWLVSRALQPIGAIGTAAARISAGDLSQRINVAETESELGELATVLNSTFARLESAFEQQKQFASDAAHELRTPVSVILSQTQTALSRERDAASYRQTVEACQRAAQRMRKLIESLLALARFDAGQEVLKRLDFDLATTVREATDLVQPLAAEKSVQVSATADPLPITGDPERLSQVILNLLTNAVQFSKPAGEVHVKLAAENGLAILTVADEGQGISAADLPNIFRRFYRADKSRTGSGNTGLGLAISKAIVEAHGGTIEATSTENAGSTFTVRLPLP